MRRRALESASFVLKKRHSNASWNLPSFRCQQKRDSSFRWNDD